MAWDIWMLLQYVVHKNMYYHTECQYVFALSLVHEFTPGQTVLVSLPLRLYNAIDHIQCEASKGRIHLNDNSEVEIVARAETKSSGVAKYKEV